MSSADGRSVHVRQWVKETSRNYKDTNQRAPDPMSGVCRTLVKFPMEDGFSIGNSIESIEHHTLARFFAYNLHVLTTHPDTIESKLA